MKRNKSSHFFTLSSPPVHNPSRLIRSQVKSHMQASNYKFLIDALSGRKRSGGADGGGRTTYLLAFSSSIPIKFARHVKCQIYK